MTKKYDLTDLIDIVNDAVDESIKQDDTTNCTNCCTLGDVGGNVC